MKSSSRSALFAVAILAAGCFGATAHAMRVPRIELLREAHVTGVNVLLADLLPADAQISLRERAGDISLGLAPQPGSMRILERSGVLENISVRGDVAAQIDVPERIVVSRDARLITVQEVFTAIRSALMNRGIFEGVNLQPEDILLQTQILVAPGDAGLKVIRSDFDAELKLGRFLLWTSQDPKVLPFFVAVRFSGNSPLAGLHGVSEMGRAAGGTKLREVPAQTAKAEVLVSPGQEATLLLQSNAFRMMAEVVPLERGTMGQRIHVRVVDTGKVFSAQVDGRAHLQMNF